MAYAMKLVALAAAATTYGLKQSYKISWVLAVPIYFLYFLAWHGYRMLIYERFLSPLSRVPGPKVDLVVCR